MTKAFAPLRYFLAKTKYFGFAYHTGFHTRGMDGKEIVHSIEYVLILRKGFRFYVLGTYHHKDAYQKSLNEWRAYAVESWYNLFT